ncbi:MAG: hypothetical protein E7384_02620 [Ruminococcaceae bacterium]|nr:hypothetical protein [Oscillospiraceae bacterium]
MRIKNFKKAMALMLATVITATMFTGCKDNKKGGTNSTPAPSATAKVDTSANDAAQNKATVAMMGEVPIYETQFEYFLFTAMSEAFYGSDAFDDIGSEEYSAMTEEDKTKMFLDFFNAKPEGSEKTNLQITAERALEICHTFNISALKGKDNKLSSQDDIDKLLDEIDEIADKYADYYKKTRDACMKSLYGMNVNDLKEYTILQNYGKAYSEQWRKDNGYTFEEKEPTKPTKPTEPSKDASDEKKSEYDAALKKYDEDLADYNDALKDYNEKEKKFWEKFREAYNKGVDAYRIVSVRSLFVSTVGEDGKVLSAAEKQAKKKEIEGYVKLSTDFGYDFEKVVKGFSESETGLYDLDIANSSETPFNEEIVLWASKEAKISKEIKIFETSKGYYAIQIAGITDFDKTEGVVADSEKVASPEKIRETVSYYYLNDLYNDYVTMLTKEADYKLSDIKYDRMYEIAEKCLNETEE